LPYGVVGEVSTVSSSNLAIKPTGQTDPVQYSVGANVEATLDGKEVTTADLRAGDHVELVLDGATNQIVSAVATRPEVSLLERLSRFWWVFLAGVLVPSALVARRARAEEPFIVHESSR
jgi:hypothetical protein